VSKTSSTGTSVEKYSSISTVKYLLLKEREEVLLRRDEEGEREEEISASGRDEVLQINTRLVIPQLK